MSQETAKKALTFPPLTGHNYTSFVAKVLSRLNDRDNGLRAISTLSEPIVDDATYHAMSDTVKKKHLKDDAAIMRIVEDLINMDNGYLTAPFFSCRNFNLNGNAPPGSFPDWWASRGRRGWDRLEQKFAPKDAGDVSRLRASVFGLKLQHHRGDATAFFKELELRRTVYLNAASPTRSAEDFELDLAARVEAPARSDGGSRQPIRHESELHGHTLFQELTEC
jgi:hypothetical protein